MKKLLIILLAFASFSNLSFGQSKKMSGKKSVLHFAQSESTSVKAFAEKDTITIQDAKFLKLDGTIYNVKQLSDFLHSPVISQPDAYWYALYQFIIGSKNADFSMKDINQLISPFLSYVERYQKHHQKSPPQ